MNQGSVLTRKDYDDFLVFLQFSPEDDYLRRCISQMYLPLARTLTGIGSHPARDITRQEATDELERLFTRVQQGDTIFASQEDFDVWHRMVCRRLVDLYHKHDFPIFQVGAAQKWINMTFKVIYAVGEERIPGFEGVYTFCHVPLDGHIIRALTQYGFPRLKTSWSRIPSYNEYLGYQEWIRKRFKPVPLDVEFLLWRRGKYDQDSMTEVLETKVVPS